MTSSASTTTSTCSKRRSWYHDLDLFEEAILGAYEDTEQERPRLEAELASAQAQLRETTSALDCYLRAFEAGTMPDTVCAPRVAALSERRDELDAGCRRLRAQLEASTPRRRVAASWMRSVPPCETRFETALPTS